ncbi:hypothetical protein [Gracilibacillus timonensis]|nr:hypothetical protein [Gracilibacillus timonensis]
MEQENKQQEELEETSEQEPVHETQAEQEGGEEQKQASKESNSLNFDFAASMKETKGIALDAIIRPHKVVSSGQSVRLETSGLILLVLALLISICSFLFYRFGFDGLLSFFEDVGFVFVLTTFFSWVITFVIGYLSVYLLLRYFGDRMMDHKQLLTQYAIVNVPFALVFCLVILFFGFLMVDLFVITYVFALMLYGLLHIYLFVVNMKQPKYDLYWTMTGYLLFLIVVSYLLTGIDFGSL